MWIRQFCFSKNRKRHFCPLSVTSVHWMNWMSVLSTNISTFSDHPISLFQKDSSVFWKDTSVLIVRFTDQLAILEIVFDTSFNDVFYTSTKPHFSFIVQHKGVLFEMSDRNKQESHMWSQIYVKCLAIMAGDDLTDGSKRIIMWNNLQYRNLKLRL